VTVGEALTEARYQAGLSVDELSQRTRIRETVIRSIERDDYDACGGDLYVRGYVRALAGAVGIDAQPLLREYDSMRAGAAGGTAFPGTQARNVTDPGATSLDLPAAPRLDADPTMLDLPPVVSADPAGPVDPAETRFDLAPVTDDVLHPSYPDLSADPAATRFDLPPFNDSPVDPPVGGDLMAAGYDLPPADGTASASGSPPWPDPPWSAPSRTAPPWPTATVTGAMKGPPGPRHGGRGRNRHLPAVAAVVVALVVAAAGLLVDHLSSGGTATGRLAAASKSQPPTVRASSTARAAKTKPAVTPTPTPKPALPPVTRLAVASAQAFGPDGLADGDNPQVASGALGGNAATPWSTEWYVTPNFGALKHGTGLLLDMGHMVTITSVAIDLSQFRGVNLQLKTGDGTVPGDLATAATVTDTGGVLRVTLPKAEAARYLLIWFTLLPPNGQGHYQETISDVLVNGRA
jgi:hypothetical protein